MSMRRGDLMKADFPRTARIGNGHDPPDMVRAGERGMGRFHHRDGLENVGREGADFSFRALNVEHHKFGGGGEPSVLGVTHLEREMHPLHIIIEKLRGNANRHIAQNFAAIGDVGLSHKHGAGTICAVIFIEAEQIESFLERPVEKDMVIGHVEMVVLVDPRRFWPHHGGDERRKKERIDLRLGGHGPYADTYERMNKAIIGIVKALARREIS
ncbi:MAG: hypothetical protein RLZ07_1584 [Pseudomonadota bacterium]